MLHGILSGCLSEGVSCRCEAGPALIQRSYHPDADLMEIYIKHSLYPRLYTFNTRDLWLDFKAFFLLSLSISSKSLISEVNILDLNGTKKFSSNLKYWKLRSTRDE
jgi:hypothetical protein